MQEIIFNRIDINNLDLACKIQNEIFPKENARKNYIEQINNEIYRKGQDYYIICLGNTPIGVTGLYAYKEYPETAWLGWFGILKQYRNKGYGKVALDKTIKLAREKQYLEFRLYTDEYAIDAHHLYKKRGLIEEEYVNPDDKDNYINAKVYIYSMSLNNKKIDKWNNKLLGLKEQPDKEHIN